MGAKVQPRLQKVLSRFDQIFESIQREASELEDECRELFHQRSELKVRMSSLNPKRKLGLRGINQKLAKKSLALAWRLCCLNDFREAKRAIRRGDYSITQSRLRHICNENLDLAREQKNFSKRRKHFLYNAEIARFMEIIAELEAQQK